MQDRPLSVRAIFEHGARIHAGSEVATFTGNAVCRSTFAQVAGRVARLAAALRRLGIRPGERLGTFCWNTQEHLEAYFAAPCMGAVLHTLNVRLFPAQLAYVVNHAGDRIILLHGSLASVLAQAAGRFETVERYIVIGEADARLPGECLAYEEVLAPEAPDYPWPEVEERSAAMMCYTSGTTGNPKGVAYSHRSIFLHSLAENTANALGYSQQDRLLVLPSMFHAAGWGMPYAGWFAGSDLLYPGRFLQAETLCRLIETERPTVAGGVPAIWRDVLRYAETHPVDFSSLRMIASGGSAVPASLIEQFQERHHVRLVQAWGMTETSPILAINHPAKGGMPKSERDDLGKAGRVVAGVELRIVADGRVLPWDGQSVGELQVRGPWVAGAYHGEESAEKFDDGWLRTGDMGTVDPQGFIQITDRVKDIIKSGGEWVSSVELENQIMAHPDVLEAAVIGVPDARWDERPLACVVLRDGARASAEELRSFLDGRVAKWWIPERWAFLEQIPKTSVGKFDKKVLRAREAEGAMTIVEARSK